MNLQLKSLLLSLALHSAVIFLLITISATFYHEPETVVIDFTVMDPQGAPPPTHEKRVKETPRQAPAATDPGKMRLPARENPSPEKVVSVPTRPEPAKFPATPQTALQTEHKTGASTAAPVLSAPPSGSGPSAAANGAAGGGPDSGSGSGSGTGRGSAGSGSDGSVTQMKERYLREQFDYIRTKIEKNLVYPAKARKMGWTGKVVVSFVILENGRVANMKIINSSGRDLLDNNVMETIRKVEPFPKPPVRAELKIPIAYRLDW